MPEFVLNRTYVMPGKGHMIRFEKGQPTWVPPELVKEAAAIGAEPLDGPVDILGPEEVDGLVLSAGERLEKISEFIKIVVARNESADFDASGKPSMGCMTRCADFAVTKKERDTAWAAYRETVAAAKV